MKEGLWGIVNGSETVPTTGEREIAKCNRNKDRALATIVLAVHSSLLHILENPTCPITVLKELQDTFQKKTWSNKLHL